MSPVTALPIDKYLNDITQKILQDKNVILNASPGSGKTTRVPAALLRRLIQEKKSQKIIVVVPKRISALSAATRVCEENNWQTGKEVGYAVRFDSQMTEQTQLVFMTDGLFLKRYSDSHFVESIGYIFLDEFHERKSNIDLILGLIHEQKILYGRPQIIVMSATMDIHQLQNFFSDSETIQIQAPPYQVTQNYLTTNQRLACDPIFYEQLKETVMKAWKQAQKDILVFLPGLREIHRAQLILQPCFPQVAIEILHGSLSLPAQKNIVTKSHHQRRIILSTNVAESSITLPDLDCVVDSGLEKNAVTEKKIGFSKLKIERISLFSALQREGRSSRTQNGFCFKLWHPIDERSMPTSIQPEILKSSLHAEILFLASVGIQDFKSFSWISPPLPHQIQLCVQSLIQWGLITPLHNLTPLGELVNQSPVDILHSILFIELLCLKNFKKDQIEFIGDLISRLDSAETRSHSTATGKSSDENDLIRLMDTPATFNQNKLKGLLMHFSVIVQRSRSANQFQPLLDSDENSNISIALFKIYSHYFPQRIISKKNGLQGLSSLGRGVELSSFSAAQQSDFYVALNGEEKNDSTTLVNYAIGVNKSDALKILAQDAKYETKIFFDDIDEVFFKQETLFYGAFKLNEKSKERLNAQDLKIAWKNYAVSSPNAFLKLNPTYLRTMDLIQFLNRKKAEIGLKDENFVFLENIEFSLVRKLTETLDTFEDFKNSDIYYYINDLIPEVIYELLPELPSSVKLPSGRQVTIDYNDPKSPLISAKIQDFFGWNDIPRLLNNRLIVTAQLLAPNMRPAQTTSDLKHFWKNSYLDVRKDLRARYPKHSWPEDPTKKE